VAAAAEEEEDRPSEEEVTRIGTRPAPEQLGTAKTRSFASGHGRLIAPLRGL
jgi:septal ring factor EnvC (AmiA/AmiB activator)